MGRSQYTLTIVDKYYFFHFIIIVRLRLFYSYKEKIIKMIENNNFVNLILSLLIYF